MILYILSILFLIFIAPMLLGIIKSLKMFLLYKKPVSILQPYYSFSKLLLKENIISDESSNITRVAPYLVLSPLLVVLFFLPPIFSSAFYVGFVDAFTIIGLISLSTFFLMLLGLDGGNSFGGLGSSREAFVASLVEPAMVLTVFSIGLMAKDLGVANASINLSEHFPIEHMASFLFSALSFFVLLLAENGRLPVDNPETHLELTMIHEAMILDLSGFYLLLIETASSIKFVIFSSLFVSLFMPFGLGFPPVIAFVIFILKMIFVAFVVALVEVNGAKLRLFKVPNLLGVSIVLAFLSLISFYVLGE